jgi:hypothetical protein
MKIGVGCFVFRDGAVVGVNAPIQHECIVHTNSKGGLVVKDGRPVEYKDKATQIRWLDTDNNIAVKEFRKINNTNAIRRDSNLMYPWIDKLQPF